MKQPTRYCSLPGCNRVHEAHGYCRYHLHRIRRGIPLDASYRARTTPRPRSGRTCSVPGCMRPHSARGYCTAHYQMERRGSEVRPLRRGYTAWTDRDDNMLRYYIGMERIEIIADRIGRGVSATRNRAWQLGLSFNAQAERHHGYNLTQTAAILGTSLACVSNWIEWGWLRADRAWSMHHQRWSVSADAIFEFLQRRGAVMTTVQITDPVWREIAAEARAEIERTHIRRERVAAMLLVDDKSIWHYIKRLGMPDAAIKLNCSGGMWFRREDVRTWLDAHPKFWTAAARRELLENSSENRQIPC